MQRTVELELKDSYNFAMSSFARMYGVRHVQCSDDIHRFCVLWAESTLPIPAGSLTKVDFYFSCLLYTSPSPRDATLSRMPSSA